MKVNTNRFTSQQRRHAEKEIDDIILNRTQKYEIEMEIAIVWVLHKYFGFGKKRLLKFRNVFVKEIKEMKEYYQVDDVYPAKIKLKEIGYDIDELTK